MEIQKDVLLAPYTTFKIGGLAKYFCVVSDFKGLREARNFALANNLPIFILGGGSNVLISDEGFNGLVVLIEVKGVEKVFEDGKTVRLKVAAGENWDKLVEYCVDNNWWGIENLSHIPGKAGAFVVQNVGAYGQEASQVVDAVTVFNLANEEIEIISNKNCEFSYRSSIFNGGYKGKFVILDIIISLSKIPRPNLSYRDLAEKFEGKNPGLGEIRQAIIEIRDNKFPFPDGGINGNAGSFFKNPVISRQEFDNLSIQIEKQFGTQALDNLQKKAREERGFVKIPAAYLIDVCSLKDAKNDHVAINHTQPLVVLNKSGKAKAGDILDLVALVRETVFSKTGIMLDVEPVLVGFAKEEVKIEN